MYYKTFLLCIPSLCFPNFDTGYDHSLCIPSNHIINQFICIYTDIVKTPSWSCLWFIYFLLLTEYRRRPLVHKQRHFPYFHCKYFFASFNFASIFYKQTAPCIITIFRNIPSNSDSTPTRRDFTKYN